MQPAKQTKSTKDEKNVKFKFVHVHVSNVYANSFFPFTARLWNNILPTGLANEKNDDFLKSSLANLF